jgi:hypothetical protein
LKQDEAEEGLHILEKSVESLQQKKINIKNGTQS